MAIKSIGPVAGTGLGRLESMWGDSLLEIMTNTASEISLFRLEIYEDLQVYETELDSDDRYCYLSYGIRKARAEFYGPPRMGLETRRG